MAKNIVYFDLETQKSADEVGGWNNISRMGMSVGVTYSTARGEYRIYGEKQVDDLITDLQRADLVVGFNILRFDYEVLARLHAVRPEPTAHAGHAGGPANTLQHRLSLDSIATATFGVEKTAEGLQAIQWFKEGKLLEIAEYCCYDVKITKLVHEYGVAPTATALPQSLRQKTDRAGEVGDLLDPAAANSAGGGLVGIVNFPPR